MTDARAAAVLRLVEAASVVAADASLVPELVRVTGLSPAGVRRALGRHLELDPTPEEIASLVRGAGEAPAVAVILSANVFVGALRAIAVARAAAERVVVRPSRREPVFAEALVAAARALGESAISIDPSLRVEDVEAGELHVYGRDETIADVRARAASGVVVRAHGSGMGVAWVSSRAELDAAGRDLAADVVAFDQQGCSSPRVALVEGDMERATSFASRLSASLDAEEAEVPRGIVPDDVGAAIATWRASMEYAGEVFAGASSVVAAAEVTGVFAVPPTHRNVLVVPVRDADAARAFVAPISRSVVAFGADDLGRGAEIAPSWARTSLLGAMQRPRLDGPVDRR